MKHHEEILKRLKEEAGQLEIPESVSPEAMYKNLQEKSSNTGRKKVLSYFKGIAAAACIGLVALAYGIASGDMQKKTGEEAAVNEEMAAATEMLEAAEVGIPYPEICYEDIYESMSEIWNQEAAWPDRSEGGMLMEDAVAEAPASDGTVFELEEKQTNAAVAQKDDVGITNVQTAGVDEGDVVKNDGRYLYQKIITEDLENQKQAIQITDTENGLKEVARITDFDTVEEFYIWEDILVAVENKYRNVSANAAASRKAYCDVLYSDHYFHEISFYNISDRSNPEQIKTFTLQGRYVSSRISDGYFYGFSRYYANKGEGEKDYDAYIPKLDGVRLQTEDIYLPETGEGTAYLVIVAIDLRNPTKFTDTTGIVSGGEMYYVSADNIYVAYTCPAQGEEGWCGDETELLRFSYGKGQFALRAEGKIQGSLNNSFSLDEYENHLRVVSTVREYEMVQIVDDRTGETVGSTVENERQTNSLYVLDESLKVVGSIESLAENERIYSARFMGATGYFVTFRQTDPLFAVDLTDPEQPKILSELKVSGFSEYLHGYSEGRLFGLGMEADEETGMQKGMKLSMFDISDTSDVQEISRLHLENYHHSEALYNHHAVMISPGKNMIGFEAEGSDSGEYWKDYLIFTYENDRFVQKMKIDTKKENAWYRPVRGTYIGDIFYLLYGDGSIQSYSLNTGEHLESLEP